MINIQRIRHVLINTILPPLCIGCKIEGFYICDRCKKSINVYQYFICPICKKRNIEGKIDKKCREESGLTRYLGAPLPYSNEIVKKAIHSLKYLHAKDIAEPLSQILIEFLEKNKFSELVARYKNQVILVPIPLYDFKERERGFNQATEIAKHIGEYYKIDTKEKMLIKRKNTPQQADIKDKEKRLQNISGAFLCRDSESIRGKTILLVDDVYTTGATMRECALTLRASGASEIWGITVVRGD